MDNNIRDKFKEVKLLALDFDGIMTDGCVYVSEDEKEAVKCSRKDSLGIAMLQKENIETIVISKETSPVVSARCKKIKIDCWQAVENSEAKLEILKRIIAKKNIHIREVAYMGDDLNDLKVLENVGLPITVRDGHDRIKNVCDYITAAKGGEHAVREVCEKILEAKGINILF
ncbi:KdsC family phosphatase [Patescibacteria group bacterium]